MSETRRGYQPLDSAADMEPPSRTPSPTARTAPNLRIHLRGGQTIETRCGSVDHDTGGRGNDLHVLNIREVEPGWPNPKYLRLDAIDAVELGDELR